MALQAFQYHRIQQQYDQIRTENRHAEEERYRRAVEAVPEIGQIDQAIAANGIAYAKGALEDGAPPVEELREKNHALTRRKEELLQAHGFGKGYLDPIYRCPDCKDTGLVGGKRCHCFQQAVARLLYRQAGLERILEEENFDHFRLDYYGDEPDPTLGISPSENIRRILGECQRFVERFDGSGESLLLYGNTGVGKTFLAHCVAKELLDTAHTVVYLTSFQLFDILARHAFGKDGAERDETDSQFRHIFDCDLLILDDLGTENVNSFVASQLYQCVNQRHLDKRSTVVSTNLSLDDIQCLYSERVFSRFVSDYRLLKIIGDDIRLKKALTS